MIVRIPQRGKSDCAICVVAIVMGDPYTYERVLRDSARYPQISPDGLFSAWWETYLRDEGFHHRYCHLEGLRSLSLYEGSVVGILQMNIPHLQVGHIVAVDEIGVVDPADNAPDHVSLDEYVQTRIGHGCVFDDRWLAVSRRPFV